MIWTSHEPINKFGNPDLQFWKFGDRDDTRYEVQGLGMHFTPLSIVDGVFFPLVFNCIDGVLLTLAVWT